MDSEPAKPSVAPDAVYAVLYILPSHPQWHQRGRLPFVPFIGMHIRVHPSDEIRRVTRVDFEPKHGLTVTFYSDGYDSKEDMRKAGWKESA